MHTKCRGEVCVRCVLKEFPHYLVWKFCKFHLLKKEKKIQKKKERRRSILQLKIDPD